MRTLMLTVSAVALSCSLAFSQTPPPEDGPAGPESDENMSQSELDAGGLDHRAPGGSDQEARGQGREGQKAGRHGSRHHMGRGGPGWRAMRAGPEIKVEIDDDGGVTVEVKCGAREEARGCADITMELLDHTRGNQLE